MSDPLQIAGAAPDSAAEATPGLPRNAQARWLQELERAQLARQSRQARQANMAPAPQDRAEQRVAPRKSEIQSELQQRRDASAQQRRFQEFASNMRASSSLADPHVRPADGSQGAGEARIARAPEVRSAPLPAPRPAAKPVPMSWPKVNVHAHWNGEGLELWVRDASLDAHARERLAARLRRELYGLQRLTVNGETIYSEEQNPWPSKR